MRWGIQSGHVDPKLPYSEPISLVCTELECPESLAYAIAWRESIHGELTGQWPSAAKVVSADGGHGLFQLTSWFPDPGWDDPKTNAYYACKDWLCHDAADFFRRYDIGGEGLVVLVAASFNAGSGIVYDYCNGPNFQTVRKLPDSLARVLDPRTSDNYASAALANYRAILATGRPAGA